MGSRKEGFRHRLARVLVLCVSLPGLVVLSCGAGDSEQQGSEGARAGQPAADTEGIDNSRTLAGRDGMVEAQILARGVEDEAVLRAMRGVPRHLFMPESARAQAYEDHPVPIGEGQTISQPYIVALMTETLGLAGGDRVLEIGTGSGYQAAVLAEIVAEVYSIEIKKPLHLTSAQVLKDLGYNNVTTKHDDGYFGWQEQAPFDAIMITASVNHVPPPLLEQLADGGRMILPLGETYSVQQLVLVTKVGESVTLDHILGVLFVPMTGTAMGG